MAVGMPMGVTVIFTVLSDLFLQGCRRRSATRGFPCAGAGVMITAIRGRARVLRMGHGLIEHVATPNRLLQFRFGLAPALALELEGRRGQ